VRNVEHLELREPADPIRHGLERRVGQHQARAAAGINGGDRAAQIDHLAGHAATLHERRRFPRARAGYRRPVPRTALIAALLLVLALPAGAAIAQSTTSTGSDARPGSTTPANESRIGGRGGFGRSARPTIRRSRPNTGARRPTTRRQTRRPLFGHGFFGSVLRFLGIAYLVNLLFGWGPGGGSPLGLLIVLGVVLWLATRRRRRRPPYY